MKITEAAVGVFAVEGSAVNWTLIAEGDVLRALARKDKGLLFVDTHAGRGDYDLHPGDTEHPAEWQSGAAKLLELADAPGPRIDETAARRWTTMGTTTSR